MNTFETQSEQQFPSIARPSFSMIFETENLATVELENIYQSLASLAAQHLPPSQANEFLIIDSGDTPAQVLEELQSSYPWITIHRAPDISYYEAKMLGASLATGEIVVFCDSDCTYVSNWLEDLLTVFQEKSEANIVAGETSTPIRNIYELAIAIHYFFPRFSNRETPFETQGYFLNNVAFRRKFLLEHPIPTHLPLFRGNCYIHCYNLCHLQGEIIWRHPRAKAEHEPPTRAFTFWRYLLMGSDHAICETLKLQLNHAHSPQLGLQETLNLSLSNLSTFLLNSFRRRHSIHKLASLLKADARRYFLFPLVFPIIVWFEFLYMIGAVITHFKPYWLLQQYQRNQKHEFYGVTDLSNWA
jgi:glycosyltransferase involved in cell wall biosynthesis